jgi:hypothetical protein
MKQPNFATLFATALFFLLPLFFSPSLNAASVLDIGTEYRLRGIAYTKANLGQTDNADYAYYSQRALAHIGGRFSPNIEMMVQFQALGVAGATTTTVSNGIANPGGTRYPNTNFQPWVQWAYFKASHLYDSPMDLTVGRQP